MTAAQPVDPARVPSLQVVESALAREEDSYRARANSIDTKSGLLLGAAGVLVVLVGVHAGISGLIAQVLALGSGAAAVRSLAPRVDKAIDVARLRDRYLGVDATTTRLVLVNTRIDLHARDERQLFVKFRYLRLAALLLLAAAVAIVIGAIVDAF